MSRALRRQLAQLDMRIIHIRERLNGSKCYIPLKDTTIEMVNAKIASIDKILHLARTYLPDTAPIDKFKQAMNEQAASLELHLDSFEFTGSRNIVFYAENFFEGEITGDSERYLKFRHIIENMPWLITWDKEKQTPSGYRFSGRLYDYTTEYDLEKYQHPEKLFTAPSPAKMPDQPRCNIETHVSIWWPPYAARLKRKQDTFTEICMKQRPYRNTLDLESELSQKTEEALSRLEIIYQLAKETNNQFIRSYKADIPPPCYKNL